LSEAIAARFDKFVKAACEKKADRLAIVLKDPRKKPMLCLGLVGRTQPHSRCRASKCGRGAFTSRSVFSL
jgi:hypothetical protein